MYIAFGFGLCFKHFKKLKAAPMYAHTNLARGNDPIKTLERVFEVEGGLKG
jgi:hypothetical protein